MVGAIKEKIRELDVVEIDQPYYREFAEFPARGVPSIEYAELEPLTTPEEILLGSLRDGRLQIQSPIKVKFNREDKYFIAEATELNEFGFGDNPSEALYDLQRAIVELYFELDRERKRLGKDLQDIWNVLQKKIITKR